MLPEDGLVRLEHSVLITCNQHQEINYTYLHRIWGSHSGGYEELLSSGIYAYIMLCSTLKVN
jgi:hypothetical protein